MENNKGFVGMTFVLAVIIILVVGGGAYYLGTRNVSVSNNIDLNNIQPIGDNLGIKTFKLGSLEFSYPEKLFLKEEKGIVSLSHSIPKKHQDSCDMVGDAPMLNEIKDFNSSFELVNLSLKESIKKDFSYDSSVIDAFKDSNVLLSTGFIDKYKVGSFDGYLISMGLEGCGRYSYYLPVSSNQTLIVQRSFYLQTYQADRSLLNNISGFITSQQEDSIFKSILTSVKGIKQQDTLSINIFFPNKIFNSEMLDCRLVYPVNRTINKTLATAGAAIDELIKGPTKEEESKGYWGVMPDGTKVNSIKVVDGVAFVDFNENIGINFTSCSGAMRLNAIGKTLLQFSTIKEIKYLVNGKLDPDELQP